MQTFQALCGTSPEDMPLLETKLGVLIKEMAPEAQDEQFQRVIELAGMPAIEPGTRIDIDKLLNVRQSAECLEFRQWLVNATARSDQEIAELVHGMRSRVGEAINSTPGKIVRFLATTAAGFTPGAGTVLGPALTALDTFLLGNVLRQPGPAAFISSQYASILAKQSRD
jgi:hypothetical protein